MAEYFRPDVYVEGTYNASSDSFNYDSETEKKRTAEKVDYLMNVADSLVDSSDGLAKVFIECDDFNAWGGKEDERKGELTFISSDTTFSAYCKMKPQGSSSLSYPKKNLNITLYEDSELKTKKEVPLKNWKPQSKFCMKANYIDPTNSCNLVCAQLAQQAQEKYAILEQAPANGLIDGIPVSVHVNGKSIGLYTFNIPKDRWQFGMKSGNVNHIIMCNETQSGAGAFLEVADSTSWSVEYGDGPTSLSKFNQLVSFIKDSTDEEFRSNLTRYLDLGACLNYYCFCHLFGAVDNLGKNMLMITYDGILWYPSLYDLDSCIGTSFDGTSPVSPFVKCPEEYQCNNSRLWEKIVRCFPNELSIRYFELRQSIFSRSNVVKTIEKFIYNIPKRIYEENNALYPAFNSMHRTLNTMRAFIYSRMPYSDLMFRNMSTMVNREYGDLLFNLTGMFIGDGVDNYVDTNVKLLRNPDRDFTLFMKALTTTHVGDVYISCFAEQGPYFGLMVRKSDQENKVIVVVGDNYGAHYNYGDDEAGETFSLVIRKVGDIYSTFVNGIKQADITSHCASYIGNLLIGCQDDATYNKFRFTRNTIDTLKLYNRALNDLQITEILDLLETDYGDTLYNLPSQFIGNGESTYVDTGLKLMSDPTSDFTLVTKFNTTIPIGSDVFVSCFSEGISSGEFNYYGILIRRHYEYTSGITVVVGNNIGNNYDLNGATEATVVIRKVEDTYSIFINGEKRGDISSYIPAYMGNLLIACQDDSTFNKFRFSGCTVKSLTVYDNALTDSQIYAILN
jgi:hypothetical protein